jgi:co-chaperonin GroES (HSP10)
MRLLLLGLIAFFVQSCAVHYGSMESSIDNSNQKYEYVDIAFGYSKVTYFMGIGGLGKDMLAAEAVRNMRMSFPLETNQTIENIVLNYKTIWIGPFMKMEAMAMADVIEWAEDCNVTFSKKHKELMSRNKVVEYSNFKISDQIAVFDGRDVNSGRIVSLNKKNAMIFFIDYKGRYQMKKAGIKAIYWTDDRASDSNDFKVGDVVAYSTKAPKGIDYDHRKGVIICMNDYFAIVNTNGNNLIFNINDISHTKAD